MLSLRHAREMLYHSTVAADFRVRLKNKSRKYFLVPFVKFNC